MWNGLKHAQSENGNEVFMIKITKLVKIQDTKVWQIFIYRPDFIRSVLLKTEKLVHD